MARLLLLTPFFHPFIHPRAHRWTALARQWASEGHEVHVVCARRRDCPAFSLCEGVHVHRTGFDSAKELVYFLTRYRQGRGRVNRILRPPGGLSRFASWLHRSLWQRLRLPDDALLWYRPAARLASRLLIERRFDAMVSVSMPFAGHLVALYLKRRHPQAPWLADIGDPFCIRAPGLDPAPPWAARLEKRVLMEADVVTVTTPRMRTKYTGVFGHAATARIHVVPPLLHPLPAPVEPTISTKKNLHVAYFGAFYAPVRTPGALLDLLDRTLEADPSWKDRLVVHLYGDVFPEFFHRLEAHPLVRLHGLRSREEVRDAMNRVDGLIHVGNTTDFQLPSKAVEYLTSGKPVAHVQYLPDDAFTEFWAEAPGLWRIQVINGKVGNSAFASWTDFLHALERGVGPVGRPEKARAYGVEALAAAYRALLGF